MIKILTVSVAVALLASSSFAGGVKETALKYGKSGPKVTLVNTAPPIVWLGLGGAALILPALFNGGSSTTH